MAREEVMVFSRAGHFAVYRRRGGKAAPVPGERYSDCEQYDYSENIAAGGFRRLYARRRVSEEVVKSLLLERKTEINSCMVYSALAQNPIYGQRASMLKEAAREGWFQKKNATQDGWYLYFATGQQENLMAIVKTIRNIDVNSYRTEDIGIVKLDLNIARLFAPAKLGKEHQFSADFMRFCKRHSLQLAFRRGRQRRADFVCCG